MSLRLGSIALRQYALKANQLTTTVQMRHASAPGKVGYWNRDWKPEDDPPATEAERVAAAKKYNMHPRDYKATPQTEFEAAGDFPDLRCPQIISADEKSDYEPWDYAELKRNFNEPVLEDYVLYNERRFNNAIYHESPTMMMAKLWGFVLFIVACAYYGRNVYLHQPMMKRQYPYNGGWLDRGLDPRKEPDLKFYEWPDLDKLNSPF